MDGCRNIVALCAYKYCLVEGLNTMYYNKRGKCWFNVFK